jgi:hypothetical protein
MVSLCFFKKIAISHTLRFPTVGNGFPRWETVCHGGFSFSISTGRPFRFLLGCHRCGHQHRPAGPQPGSRAARQAQQAQQARQTQQAQQARQARYVGLAARQARQAHQPGKPGRPGSPATRQAQQARARQARPAWQPGSPAGGLDNAGQKPKASSQARPEWPGRPGHTRPARPGPDQARLGQAASLQAWLVPCSGESSRSLPMPSPQECHSCELRVRRPMFQL